MSVDNIERVHYYERQFLGAQDFVDEQDYQRDMRRRHNIGQHTWGIVVGMELVEKTKPGLNAGVDVFVQPGYAVDGFGRELVVFAPYPVDAGLFASFVLPKSCQVWIEFDEEQASQATGFEQCDPANQYNRISEGFKILIDPDLSTGSHDPVMVAGNPAFPPSPTNTDPIRIPADESVPYQELPADDAQPRWLIRLGNVNWDGSKLISAGATLNLNRQYAAAVGERLLSPTSDLEIAPRAAFADPDAQPFATVQGQLEVQGRITADKDVDVPAGTLDFGSQARQMINLWSAAGSPPKPQYGIGVQSDTTYFRSHNQFCFFKDGSHKNNPGDPGPGGTLLLTLDTNGQLDFGAFTKQMLNLYNANYGVGVQHMSLYFRSDADFCWFRGGNHSDTRDDAGGGALAMRLDDLSGLSVAGDLSTGGNILVGKGVDRVLTTRHIHGKDYQSDALDNLYLNWDTGKDVVIGTPGGTPSSLRVSGNLVVDGNNNIFKVWTVTVAVTNAGENTPATWSVGFPGMFAQVYSAFAVLQGFSIYSNNPSFTNWGHNNDANAIPQHVFVRVDGWDNSSAHGISYCSESLAGNETDNTVLFTVVILGRGIV